MLAYILRPTRIAAARAPAALSAFKGCKRVLSRCKCRLTCVSSRRLLRRPHSCSPMYTARSAPEAPARKLRLVAPIHLANVVALDVADGVDRDVARKRHRQIIAQAQQLATLRARNTKQNTLAFVLGLRCGNLQLQLQQSFAAGAKRAVECLQTSCWLLRSSCQLCVLKTFDASTEHKRGHVQTRTWSARS